MANTALGSDIRMKNRGNEAYFGRKGGKIVAHIQVQQEGSVCPETTGWLQVSHMR